MRGLIITSWNAKSIWVDIVCTTSWHWWGRMKGKVINVHVIIRWGVWSTRVSVTIPVLVWLTKRARERWGLNTRHVGRLSTRFAVKINITSSGEYVGTATSLQSITKRIRRPLGLLDRKSVVTKFEILRQ